MFAAVAAAFRCNLRGGFGVRMCVLDELTGVRSRVPPRQGRFDGCEHLFLLLPGEQYVGSLP